jgi:hypothetical protein
MGVFRTGGKLSPRCTSEAQQKYTAHGHRLPIPLSLYLPIGW